MYSKTAFTTAKLDAAVSHTVPQVAFLKSLHGAFISGCGSQESPGMFEDINSLQKPPFLSKYEALSLLQNARFMSS